MARVTNYWVFQRGTLLPTPLQPPFPYPKASGYTYSPSGREEQEAHDMACLMGRSGAKWGWDGNALGMRFVFQGKHKKCTAAKRNE